MVSPRSHTYVPEILANVRSDFLRSSQFDDWAIYGVNSKK